MLHIAIAGGTDRGGNNSIKFWDKVYLPVFTVNTVLRREIES